MIVQQEPASLKKYDTEEHTIAIRNKSLKQVEVIVDDDNISIDGSKYLLETRNFFIIERNGNIQVYHNKNQVFKQFGIQLIIFLIVILLIFFVLKLL